MKHRGFVHHGTRLQFSRIVGDGVHQIISGGLSYGANLKFSVTCFVEEFDPECMNNYPTEIPMTCGGGLGEGLLARELWEVGEDDGCDLNEIFEDVIRNIDEHALPWFETVRTRAAYVEALYPHFREELVQTGRLDSVLFGATATE